MRQKALRQIERSVPPQVDAALFRNDRRGGLCSYLISASHEANYALVLENILNEPGRCLPRGLLER